MFCNRNICHDMVSSYTGNVSYNGALNDNQNYKQPLRNLSQSRWCTIITYR